VTAARDEFEVLPRAYNAGTSKLYSRADFLPLDDPRGRSEADFIGRLRALFGPVDDDQYVLRHRATGFIVTAYSAQSGPSYGGGPCYPGELAEPDPSRLLGDLFAAGQERGARVQADPVLAQGRPMTRVDFRSLGADELRALREEDHAWTRRFHDVAAPPGLAAVVARLDQLVEAAQPADWEAIRYWSDEPLVYRVGVRGGAVIDEELPAREGLEWLLEQAEHNERDERALRYWVHNARRGMRIEAALPRVQAMWFRSIAQTKSLPLNFRDLWLAQARDDAALLQIDSEKAEAALR
jgi:hypothetical protein